jgi:MFS family permease
VAVAGGILFAYTSQVVLWAVLADEHFGIGADALTVLYAAYGLGGILATVPAARAAAGRDIGRVLAGAVVIGGLSVVALARVTDLPVAVALVAIQGVVVTMADVLGITLLQRALGAAVLGRAIGTLDSATSVAMVSGSAIAPVLLGAGGLGGGFVVIGIALALVGVAAAVVLRRPALVSADTVERARRLAGLPLFAGAPQFALEGLAESCREMRVAAGTVVIREGDAPDDLYVLLTGAATVTTVASAAPINTMHAGDFFGEIGLLRRVPRTATVTTTEPSTLLRIDGELFLELVGAGVAHGATLGRSVGQRIARTRGAATL